LQLIPKTITMETDSMPELPEVEAVARKLRAAALGAEIVSAQLYRAQMTAPQKPATLKRLALGRRIEAVGRRGKNILLHLSGGVSLRVHLRMTGNLAVFPDSRLLPVTARIWFGLDGGRALALDDPRALGRVTAHKTAALPALLKDIGPEPLSPDFTLRRFCDSARRTPKPMKIFLMDQKAVAGLGNIYAAEALFQSRIHPFRPARRVSPARLAALHAAIVDVLRNALDSALTAYEKPNGLSEGEFFPVAVYGREGEPCFACGAAIRRIPQGGRSTYYCPRCQK
jgi:formamidopyrimidine-DNA glycosylase